jgi:hypothetical protein
MQLHSFFVQLQAFPVQLQVSDNKQIHETHLLGAVFVVFSVFSLGHFRLLPAAFWS